MPELPEVNAFKAYFDQTSLDQRIESVEVWDDFILRNLTGDEFAERLRGRTFISSYRQGKYLFAALDNGYHVLLHFGMNGDLAYYESPDDQPRFERFRFNFENGMRLGFEDSRKFARILYIEDRDAYIEQIGLGPDATRLTREQFMTAAAGRKGTLKGFLLNQGVAAGMGNLYADEICYQTRIHPGSRMDKIPAGELNKLYTCLHRTMNEAAERLPHYKQYPPKWYWKLWREAGKKIGRRGTVEAAKIGGRTTMYVPGWQTLYE